MMRSKLDVPTTDTAAPAPVTEATGPATREQLIQLHAALISWCANYMKVTPVASMKAAYLEIVRLTLRDNHVACDPRAGVGEIKAAIDELSAMNLPFND